MGWATITHIAYAVDNVPHNLRGRMTDLVKRGYLRMSTGDSMSQYCVTDMALEELGIDDHGPKGKPNASGTAHRNKLNTILLRLSLGWERAAETVERDVSSKQARYAYENRRKADANEVLMRDKQRILAMDPNNRTATDNRILNRKPAAMTQTPTVKDMVEHMGLAHDDSDERNAVFNESRVVIPERFIVRDTSITTTLGCKVDWEAECEQFLRETPVQDASNATLSKVMEQHKAWVFTHWDVNGKWGKSHRPDGVVVLPSKVDSNGEVRGGCIWIEMEDHRKPQVADYVRVIQQAIDHPLVDAVYYYTPHRSVSTMIKKAVDTVVKELVAGDRSNRSFEAKESDARELVARSVRVLKQPLINRMASEGGYWG
jgi:hypothetical protein